MKRRYSLAIILVLLSLPCCLFSQQPWSGILAPTYGEGACTLSPTDSAAGCAIDWSQSGIPGGIPSSSWTQSGTTIAATGSDQTSQIQSALNACGTNHFVLLSTGTFTIDTTVSVPANCELRGSGANQTILTVFGNSTAPVTLGGGSVSYSGALNITSGGTAGSTSLTLSGTTGVTVGGYLVVSETNNASWVTIHGGEGDCTWCDGWSTNGNRARGQIVEVENIAGNVVTISPGLYTAYTNSPTVIPFTAAAKYAGLSNLQIYSNNTGYGNAIYLSECAYCWVQGVEVNYSDANFLEDDWGYRDQIQSNYFSNDFVHSAGSTDSCVFLVYKTTATQVVNNIIERGHVSIMLNWGAAGNVVAYNYMEGEFDSGNTTFTIGGISMHGAHPQFNLLEGNVGNEYYPDQVWGSSSHNTNFRNWFEGTTANCTPTNNTRGTVTCTGSNKTWEFQASYAEDIDHYSWYDNFIGDISGSANQNNLIAYGTTQTSQVAILPWSSSGPLRSYDMTNYNFTFGFGEVSDDGHSSNGCDGATVTPCHSVVAYETSLLYNTYTFANTTTNCLSGGSSSTCMATLPASFYLSSQPSWWPPTISYPAIGPDVTGGTGPGGHTSLTASNPAQNCYLNVMGGVEGGAGSPLTFNANNCYPAQTNSLLPPTGLSAVSR